MVGRAAHPVDERLVRGIGHLLRAREVEVGVVVVVVLADHVHVVEALLEERPRPVGRPQVLRNQLVAQLQGLLGAGHGVGHGAAGDEDDAGVDLAHRLREEVVLDRVLREGHVAVLIGAPHLVADVPELDAVGLRVAVGGALRAPGRGGRAVRVLDVLGSGAGVAEAGVDGDVRLDARQAAQGHELVGADVVGLDCAPDGVPDRRALVRVADRVAPVVGGDEVAPRPAIDARAKGLEDGDDLGPPAVHVVRGHQRHGADAQGAGAGRGDLDLAVVAVDGALEGEGEPAVGGSQLADRQRLAVRWDRFPRRG